MGMPITVAIPEPRATADDLEQVFAWFTAVDETFSPYKVTSEISRLNAGDITEDQCSADVRLILALSEATRRETNGYFNIEHNGRRDPSGIVKGWAIQRAAGLLRGRGFQRYYVDAGGDIQVATPAGERPWRVGVRNPFNRTEIVKVLTLTDQGVATSGTAIRGQHVYNPLQPGAPLLDVVSLTVVGPNVYEADRFATAAFAMGRSGIAFIERVLGLEGYMIDAHARGTATTGLERYVALR